MIKLLAVFFLVIVPCSLMAQSEMVRDTTNTPYVGNKRDLIDIARSIVKIKPRQFDPDDDKDVNFSILPISNSSLGGGKTLVTSTTASFYLGEKKTTYVSSINFMPYTNFKGRYGLPISANIWLKDNEWTIQSDFRVLKYPQYTWGLGGGGANDNNILLDYKYVRFYASALKRIEPYFFAGIGYNLDYYLNIHTADASQLRDFTGYQYGTQSNSNSFSSGASISLLYDTRNSAINPLPGCFATLIYRVNPKGTGSQSTWQSLYFDARHYISLNETGKKSVLALWTYYWTTLGKGTPYLNLPSIGWDPYQRSGRGIDQNRYRGESMIYVEAEHRQEITRNGLFGYVMFASINSVTEPNSRHFKYFNPAGGAGLRVKFNKKSDTNIGIDYAFSKGHSGFSINLGEAF